MVLYYIKHKTRGLKASESENVKSETEEKNLTVEKLYKNENLKKDIFEKLTKLKIQTEITFAALSFVFNAFVWFSSSNSGLLAAGFFCEEFACSPHVCVASVRPVTRSECACGWLCVLFVSVWPCDGLATCVPCLSPNDSRGRINVF